MKKENLYEAIGEINEDYINEAHKTVKKKSRPVWVKWVSMAACLSLIVMVGIFGNLFPLPDTPDISDNSILSYFVITAQAANEEPTELNFTSSCINSGKPNYNLFGHDMPLFHFDVKPSELENNEAVYQRFDISISYDGTTVTVADEHISVAYLASAHSSQTYGYSIFGWFTEPTDVIVTITDKESREIVEMLTVNVKYMADTQEYELELTNLTTKFSELSTAD